MDPTEVRNNRYLTRRREIKVSVARDDIKAGKRPRISIVSLIQRVGDQSALCLLLKYGRKVCRIDFFRFEQQAALVI